MSGIKNLLILALAGASLLPSLASAADAPAATFTAEQEADRKSPRLNSSHHA